MRATKRLHKAIEGLRDDLREASVPAEQASNRPAAESSPHAATAVLADVELERHITEHVTAWLAVRGLGAGEARPLWQDIAEDLWRSEELRRRARQDRRLLEGLVTRDIARRTSAG